MFEAMLPHMPSPQRLDVAYTDISCKALRRIRRSARLKYLDVSHCSNLLKLEFAHFFTSYPAIKQSLVTLCASGASYNGQFLAERDVI